MAAPGLAVFPFDEEGEQEIKRVAPDHRVKLIGDEKSVSLRSSESQKDSQIVEVKATGLPELLLISISLNNP